jgi:hypothetical protein
LDNPSIHGKGRWKYCGIHRISITGGAVTPKANHSEKVVKMKQQGKKKEWGTPELLVLVRSHPEEAVLIGCKISPFGGPATFQSGCGQNPSCVLHCSVETVS